MRLTESVALVGSGRFGLSNPFDCRLGMPPNFATMCPKIIPEVYRRDS